MRIDVIAQLVSLAAALSAGLLLGILYDILKLMRGKRDKRIDSVWDIVFAALVCFVIFVMTMGRKTGSINIWELAALILGFYVYLKALRGLFKPLAESISHIPKIVYKKFKNFLNKMQLLLKNLF